MLSVAAFAVAPSAFAQRTAQDVAQARVLYSDGMDLKDKGDLKGALEKFKAAHALGNTPLTGIELCKTHQTLHQPVEAREACLSVGRIGPIPEESQRSKDARTEAAKIAEVEKPKMGSIRVKIVGAPAGMQPKVLIDGVELHAAALDAPRPVNPGPHVILASVGSGGQTKASLETKEGENREVEVPVKPPAADETKPPPSGDTGGSTAPVPKKQSSAVPIALYILGGTAAAVGGIAGLSAMSSKSKLEDDGNCAANICGRASHEDLDSAKSAANVATISFIIAGVFVGAGVVTQLVLNSSKNTATKKRAPVGFTFRGLDGTF